MVLPDRSPTGSGSNPATIEGFFGSCPRSAAPQSPPLAAAHIALRIADQTKTGPNRVAVSWWNLTFKFLLTDSSVLLNLLQQSRKTSDK
jgi:hypothetical protein